MRYIYAVHVYVRLHKKGLFVMYRRYLYQRYMSDICRRKGMHGDTYVQVYAYGYHKVFAFSYFILFHLLALVSRKDSKTQGV